jgi:diguanylate cyclase (GGDEF)-like protein
MAIYLVIGLPGNQSNRHTDIVLSDEFICDLPATREHQAAVDLYAAAVGKRLSCGSAHVFYCQSQIPIRAEITWPMESVISDSVLRTWLRVGLTDLRDGTLAKCVAFLAPFQSERTVFDTVKSVINRARTAVDQKVVRFYKREAHPQTLQPIDRDTPSTIPASSHAEIERFIAGKVYWLAFRVADRPGETWIADPWDAEYLSVTVKELSQSAYVLRARGLLELDSDREFARPADKLLTTGLPAALESMSAPGESQRCTLSALPKKEKLISDVRGALSQPSDLALLVIDLDEFKQVNDTKGHAEGDACLERVVNVIGDILRRKGTLYRWGGDEFAVWLPNFSTDEAYATAERIRRAILAANPGGDIAVTASIGICGSDRVDNRSAEAMLDAADKAMYASKRTGKNRVTCWPVDEVRAEQIDQMANFD